MREASYQAKDSSTLPKICLHRLGKSITWTLNTWRVFTWKIFTWTLNTWKIFDIVGEQVDSALEMGPPFSFSVPTPSFHPCHFQIEHQEGI